MDIRLATVRAAALVLLTAPALSVLPAPGWAQGLEEITVTARKREESLADVPISISAFTAEDIGARNISTGYDLQLFTPNFSFQRNLGRRIDAPAIRGQFTPLIGNTDPNVSFFVDGAYVSGSAGTLTVDNLERIEVLRGPQAALFGRATFAGAINYITRKPTNELTGEANFKYGEDEDYKAAAWASGPIIEDKVFFFASASKEGWEGEWRNGLEQGQADITDMAGPFGQFIWAANGGQPPLRADNTQLGGEETTNLTGKLLFTPVDNLEITLKAENINGEDDHFASLAVPVDDLNCYVPGVNAEAAAGSPGWYCGELRVKNSYKSELNLPNLKDGVTTQPFGSPTPITSVPAPFLGQKERIKRYLAEAVYTLENDWSLTGRYTDTDIRSRYSRDLDRTYALGPVTTGLFEQVELEDREDSSWEFRVQSPQDEPVFGLLGYYYYDFDQFGQVRDFNGFGTIREDGSRDADFRNFNARMVENRAIFGTLGWNITDQLTAEFDGRYAEDEISQNPGDASICSTRPQNCPSEVFYSFSPRFTLRYAWTDEINVYFQIAEGNKPGGFNFAYFDTDTSPDELEAAIESGRAFIEEEEATTWEVGSKGTLLDGRLGYSSAAFYIDWTNQAVNITDFINVIEGPPQPNVVVDNAGESYVTGVELELTYFINDYLSAGFTYGWQKTELEEYNDDEFAALSGIDDPDLINGGNVSGNQAPRVPEHQVSTNLTFNDQINSELSWFARTDFVYESKKYGTVSNLEYVGDMYIWNARVGLDADQWTLTAYIDNILDDDTPTLIQDFPLFDAAEVRTTDANGLVYPTAFQLTPRRGTNVGMLLQYRF